MQNQRVYFDSSPVSYATTDRNRARFLFIHGTADDVVDPTTQFQAFQNALNQVGIYIRRFVISVLVTSGRATRSKARSGATGRPSRRRSFGFWRARSRRLRHAVNSIYWLVRSRRRSATRGQLLPREHEIVCVAPRTGQNSMLLRVKGAASGGPLDHLTCLPRMGDSGSGQAETLRPGASHCGIYSALITSSLVDLGLLVQNHVQQGTVDFNLAVVINETQFPKSVHEKAHARSSRAGHLRQVSLG
jgi:hypothetical protein